MSQKTDEHFGFKAEESRNFFYHYSEDHSKTFLFDDDTLLRQILVYSDPLSNEYQAVSTLVGSGNARLLRSLKDSTFMLRENCYQSMEREIHNSHRKNDLYLRVFYDYCDAIGFFSDDEKAIIDRKRIQSKALKIFCCLIAVCVIVGILLSMINPLEYIRPRHIYGYSLGKTNKKVDVEIYQDQVRQIVINDDEESVLVTLSAYENDWGEELSITQNDPANNTITTVQYYDNDLLPVFVSQRLPEGVERKILYGFKNGMMSYVSETVLENDQVVRKILYDEDGTIREIQKYDEKDGMLCYSLHPTLEYCFEQHIDDHTHSTWYKRPDGSTYFGCVEKDIDDKTFLVEEYGEDRLLTFIRLYIDDKYLSIYPSEKALLSPPLGETSYNEAGRIQKISWGPTPLNNIKYYEYFYRDDGKIEKIEYHTAQNEYDKYPQTTTFLLDDHQHIVEIVGRTNFLMEYHTFLTYGENGKILSADIHEQQLDDGQMAYVNHQSYHYNAQDQLESISINMLNSKEEIVLYFDSNGMIENVCY